MVAKFQLPPHNNFKIIEDINEKMSGFRTLGASHLNDRTLSSSWKEEGPLLVRAARYCVWDPSKPDLFHGPCFHESGKALLRQLHSLYKELCTDGSHSFSTFLCSAPSANEAVTASVEQIFFNNMRPHQNDSHYKAEKWGARNGLRLQRLVQSVDKFLT